MSKCIVVTDGTILGVPLAGVGIMVLPIYATNQHSYVPD